MVFCCFRAGRSAVLAALATIILTGVACEDDGIPPVGYKRIMPDIDQYPAWSPDGSVIAFNHIGVVAIDYEAQTYDINNDSAGVWLIRPDGTNKRMFLQSAMDPCWSPNSEWLAVTYGDHDIWKIKADGDSLTRLTFGGRNYFPSWSPVGDLIAYDSNLLGHGGYSVWLMKADGTEGRLLVPGRVADWRPDGGCLAYLGRIEDVGLGIVKYDLEDSTETLLFDAGETDILRYIGYSPDGQKVAFNWADGHVWVMESDGANPRPLTSGTGESELSWSPDGTQIVYAGKRGLWIANSDGSEPRQLTFPPN